jgi:NAD(P)-dependent dehydrogenase (short-subunit alcohol dehydrogenase family)
MSSFKDKNVVITGATGGIGSKVAKKLLKAGAKVVMLV